MCRRSHYRLGLLLMVSASLLAGCDYSPTTPAPEPIGIINEGNAPVRTGIGGGQAITSLNKDPMVDSEARRERKTAILKAVINLIQTAAIRPGGQNFKQAIEKLNDYFEGSDPAAYTLSPAASSFLLSQTTMGRKWGEPAIKALQSPNWDIKDARHIEDCMLYYSLTAREAGNGDELTRVRRIFDWIVNHVQLVPAGSLSVPDQRLGQAQARPHDVLLRGMATEDGHGWSERGWLFISFCRQLGIDAGLLTFTPPKGKEPEVWICAVLIDKKAYLFDPRIGMPIPGPGGKGVATLDDAFADPQVLARLDLPGLSRYGTTCADLRGSSTKIGVLIDSSPGYLSPKMQLLQRELVGKDRSLLFRDPAEQRDRFAEALGDRFGGVQLWDLPIMVETSLFTDPKFVEATLRSLDMFKPELPLLRARVQQLRGDTSEAIEAYVQIRFADNLKLQFGDAQIAKKAKEAKMDGVPPQVQQALDAYSTYFLGLAHLDQNNPKQAEFFFNETLRLLPRYGPGQPFYTMFRWGAQSNLGRLREARGDTLSATACYTDAVPTPQFHGDLLRARELIWNNPMAPLPPALPMPALLEHFAK